MKKTLLLSLASTLTLFASQTSLTFDKTFGGEEDDTAKAVVKTDDGYLIAGKTKSFTSHRDYDAYLIKIDRNGQKVWSKAYGGRDDDSADALTAYGKDFVFLGSTESYGNDNLSYFFNKINASGDLDWQRTYYRGERDYYFGEGIVADGDDLVLAGTEKHLKFMSTKINPLLFKINAEGEMSWRSYIYGKDDDFAYNIIKTEDGYLMVGKTETYGHGNFDAYMVKLDKQGEKIWFTTFGGDDDEEAQDIIATKNGYILVGTTDSFGLNYKDIYVVKTDKDGKKIWERSYGGRYDDEGYAITQSPDGGYVVVGKSKTRRNGDDLYLFKIDEKGKIKWQRSYGGEGDDAGYDIVSTQDGYLIVGEKESERSRSNDVWVLKVDLNGKL